MQLALEDGRVDLLRDNDYPLVMIGRPANTDGLSYIDLDFESAVHDAYAHLIRLGHRHIAFLTFSENWRLRGLGPAMRSLRGFHKTVEKFQVAPIYRECELEVAQAYCITKQVVSADPQLTAFVAAHNTGSVGAIRALHDLQRPFPADFSIVAV